MKKLGVFFFGIVFILGLSIEATAEQQVDIVNPDGVVATGDWAPDPVVSDLNDWDAADPDASYTTAYDWYSYLTVDFENPTGGPFTAIKVKLRAKSAFGDPDELTVGIYVGGNQIDYDQDDILDGSFQEYPFEWTGLNMTAAELADLQVKIEVTDFYDDWVDISAIQVELVSEAAAPPEEPDPIHVTMDYRPYKKSNPLNYRSRGKVRVVIFGSADFDVRQIDRESVRLEGVAPVRDRIRRVYSRADRARNDYHDLVLMFKTQQLIKALEIPLEKELENGDQVVLNLTGNLKDDGASPIEGEDWAVVYGKRHKHKKNGKWKHHWKWWR
jgi:hypothetical protein